MPDPGAQTSPAAAASPAAPEAGVVTPPATPALPFHEDPQIQGYIQRQVAKGIEIALQTMGKDPASATADDYDLIAKEFAKEHGMEEDVAKRFVGRVSKISEKQVKEVRSELNEIRMTLRFGAVFAADPDAKSYEKKMSEIYGGMTEFEKNFVLNSPDGPSFLLSKAKNSVAGGLVPPSARPAGGSPPSGSRLASDKLGDNSGILTKASEALARGDKNEYTRLLSQIRK